MFVIYKHKIFCENLKKFRELNNLTQKELSQRTGGSISASYISSLENFDSKRISIEKMFLLCTALGVTPDELIGLPSKNNLTAKEQLIKDNIAVMDTEELERLNTITDLYLKYIK